MSKEVKTFKEVKLNTLHMYDECDHNDSDYTLWQKIAEYMNEETALVIESGACDGKYVFLGLKDPVKDKELMYMMEQDSMVGIFINDREGFDKAYENGEYEPDCNIYLESQYLIFEHQEEKN